MEKSRGAFAFSLAPPRGSLYTIDRQTGSIIGYNSPMPGSRDKRRWQFSLSAVFGLTVVVATVVFCIRTLLVTFDPPDRQSYLPSILGYIGVGDAACAVRILMIVAMVTCVSYLAKSRVMFLAGSFGALLGFIVPEARSTGGGGWFVRADHLFNWGIFGAVVVCGIVALRLARAHRSDLISAKAAVKWVYDNGGRVRFRYKPGARWKQIFQDDFLNSVIDVNLGGTQVSDLEPLRDLPQLEWLDLQGTQVSDLEPLRDLTQLQQLYLYITPVSDLSPLVGMKDMTIHLYENQQMTIPEELKDRVERLPFP